MVLPDPSHGLVDARTAAAIDVFMKTLHRWATWCLAACFAGCLIAGAALTWQDCTQLARWLGVGFGLFLAIGGGAFASCHLTAAMILPLLLKINPALRRNDAGPTAAPPTPDE